MARGSTPAKAGAIRVYEPGGPQGNAFHMDQSFWRGLRGPVGSGKTTACCYELMFMAQQQAPSPIDGWRRTRWAVVRNTYRELEMTTVKSWLGLFPPEVFGTYRATPPFRHLIVDPATRFEMDVYFVALDRDDTLRTLLGSEWTGIFFNEAREMSKAMVDQAVSRVRRYPSMEHGGPTRPGVVADTNAPSVDHWWAYMSGEVPLPETMSEEERSMVIRPPDWAFFSQPPALLEVFHGNKLAGYEVNPKAENLKNLHPDYYRDQWQGKERSWIEVYLLNRYRTLRSGKPVYPNFREDVHVSKVPLHLDPTLDTWVGLDFGLTPAAAVIQRTPLGQYLVVGELVTEYCPLPKFFTNLNTYLQSLNIDPESVRLYGDPSGDNRDQQGITALNLARAAGLTVIPAPTNDPSVRIGAVSGLLERMVNGVPALVLAPQCIWLKRGFIDGYRYRKLQTRDGLYEEKPNKNPYSHVHDALQYAVLGAGEGRVLMGSALMPSTTTVTVQRTYTPWRSRSRFARNRQANVW